MNVGDIINYLNEIAPWQYAEEWDSVGLMVGSRNSNVSKILLCMDVTSDVISEAVENGAQMILSHHPFIFSKLKAIDMENFKGEQIVKLIKSNVTVVSAHTNLDTAPGGVNDTLAETLHLINCHNLKPYIPKGSNCDLGMGKIGELLDYKSFDDFVKDIKKNLGIENLRIIGKKPEKVKNIGVFCGSFDGDLENLKSRKVDVLVTGDIKYHTALDAAQMGLCIVDAGHFATERIILHKLKDTLNKRFKELDIICSKVEIDPFTFA
ncbi:Nif3-like dinuclear metal center hexameric protein [Ruminiclostridium josui]|uniref:Nif3-like dinuclear metal center hexameric protein n=1 Tax=Ruminiclostridium josui TaxID=1499 RepID=UPI000467DC41|nr:Nif3-like dinuclear metal center hexameric protein [Ruminiclostridium josui]